MKRSEFWLTNFKSSFHCLKKLDVPPANISRLIIEMSCPHLGHGARINKDFNALLLSLKLAPSTIPPASATVTSICCEDWKWCSHNESRTHEWLYSTCKYIWRIFSQNSLEDSPHIVKGFPVLLKNTYYINKYSQTAPPQCLPIHILAIKGGAGPVATKTKIAWASLLRVKVSTRGSQRDVILTDQ